MKKKSIIILIICVVVAVLIFLFRVSIYNKIQGNKIKSVIMISDISRFMTSCDYNIMYHNGEDSSLYEDNWCIFENENKIIYYICKKPKLPHLGFDDTYMCVKIDDLTLNDISSIKKYLNKKNDKAEDGSIYIYSFTKNTNGYISDKSQATELYDILERVKNN